MTIAVLQRINDLRAVLATIITQFTEIAQELATWQTKVQYTQKEKEIGLCNSIHTCVILSGDEDQGYLSYSQLFQPGHNAALPDSRVLVSRGGPG